MKKKARSCSQTFAAQPRAVLSHFFLWTLYSASSPQRKSAQQVSEKKKTRAFLRHSPPRTPAFFFLITPFVPYTAQASQAKSAQQMSEKNHAFLCAILRRARPRFSLPNFPLNLIQRRLFPGQKRTAGEWKKRAVFCPILRRARTCLSFSSFLFGLIHPTLCPSQKRKAGG